MIQLGKQRVSSQQVTSSKPHCGARSCPSYSPCRLHRRPSPSAASSYSRSSYSRRPRSLVRQKAHLSRSAWALQKAHLSPVLPEPPLILLKPPSPSIIHRFLPDFCSSSLRFLSSVWRSVAHDEKPPHVPFIVPLHRSHSKGYFLSSSSASLPLCSVSSRIVCFFDPLADTSSHFFATHHKVWHIKQQFLLPPLPWRAVLQFGVTVEIALELISITTTLRITAASSLPIWMSKSRTNWRGRGP
ncbi:hypothetical protein KC349_g267 [Hortaea werneckii]|nr:hypothetical protein KC349_g267 [Hortaea werneckii]